MRHSSDGLAKLRSHFAKFRGCLVRCQSIDRVDARNDAPINRSLSSWIAIICNRKFASRIAPSPLRNSQFKLLKSRAHITCTSPVIQLLNQNNYEVILPTTTAAGTCNRRGGPSLHHLGINNLRPRRPVSKRAAAAAELRGGKGPR